MKQEVLEKLKRLRGTTKPRVIADYLGIDESTYNKMENGTSNTWGDYLPSLVKYHQTTLTDFFEDIDGDTFCTPRYQRDER